MVGSFRFMAAAGVMSLVALAPGPLEAQRGGARLGRFEVVGMDFAPDGAWRKRVGQIRSARMAALRSGSLSALNASRSSGLRFAGTYNIPVVLISYSNVAVPYLTSSYTDVLFNPAPATRPYSVKTYYEEASRNLITMNGVVFDPIVADNPDTYYEDGCRGIGLGPLGQPQNCLHPGQNGTSARFGELLTEILTKLDDGTVNWGQFDNDGPDGIANSGDDDGFVDFINFIHPEVDGACGTTHLWSHRFVINGVSATNYTTKTARAGGGFVRVRDYTLQSGVGGNDGCTGGQIMPIGTIAHETGHAFGLPDLYDTNGPSEGIGEWGLMGSGNYTRSYSPAGFEAWSLFELGWVAVDTLTASRTVTVNPIQVSDTIFYAALAGTDEFILLENRDSLLSDTAQMNSGYVKKKSPGLLIWHIDQSLVDTRMGSNSVNSGQVHGVALEQADGLNQLRATSGGNRGDTGDSYPGSTVNRSWTTSSNPAAHNNASAYAGFIIDSIYRNASGVPHVPSPIVLRFSNRAQSVFTTDRNGAIIKVNSTLTQRFEDVVAEGDIINLEALSPQTITSGRTQLTFASWSDGGAQIHSVVSGATPDTVVASYTAKHKVNLVSAPNGGTVSSDIAGSPNLVTGSFVAEGTPVTLTATPTAGNTFFRYQGDTTTTNPILVLPMGRPYSVTAIFNGAVAIVTQNAVNSLLGVSCSPSPCMSSQQLTFMDQTGNNDGTYNLGDFLAYADRTGLNPASEAMQRLLSQPTVSVPLGAPTTPKER